jgi:hypothetical protein
MSDLPDRLEALAVKFERAARTAEAENAASPDFALTARALSCLKDAGTIREAIQIIAGKGVEA